MVRSTCLGSTTGRHGCAGNTASTPPFAYAHDHCHSARVNRAKVYAVASDSIVQDLQERFGMFLAGALHASRHTPRRHPRPCGVPSRSGRAAAGGPEARLRRQGSGVSSKRSTCRRLKHTSYRSICTARASAAGSSQMAARCCTSAQTQFSTSPSPSAAACPCVFRNSVPVSCSSMALHAILNGRLAAPVQIHSQTTATLRSS